jgi:hypothetical protein
MILSFTLRMFSFSLVSLSSHGFDLSALAYGSGTVARTVPARRARAAPTDSGPLGTMFPFNATGLIDSPIRVLCIRWTTRRKFWALGSHEPRDVQ